MNKNIKQLVEYIAFNPSVLQDDKPKSKLKQDIVNDHLSIISIDETNILWDDLSVYTLDEIKNLHPKGYPIGVNIIDDKYVSLQFVNKKDRGSKKAIDIVFSSKHGNKYPSDIQIHDDLYRGTINDLQIEIKNNFYKRLTAKDLRDKFGDCFNGKEQTEKILNDLSYENDYKDDYPAVYYVNKFNPGDTKPGDWYIPEIGELAQIYIMVPVINYICQELIQLEYNDIYPEIKDYIFWSSTFYSSVYVYDFYMCLGGVYYFNKSLSLAVLAMLELPTL